jgi:thiamine biosynthesis lipoprotein
MKPAYLTFFLMLPLLCSACDNDSDPVFRDQFFAFGTLIELTFYGIDPALAAQASNRLEQGFLARHEDWHAWEPGTLTATNQALATGKPFNGAAHVLPLLVEANRLSRLSNGLFNPTVGKLIDLWGFHENERAIGTLPATQAIDTLLEQAPSADDVTIEGTRISNRNPAVQYDLGAFAKGYAIDIAIEELRSSGIHNAIVSAGGDLRTIGSHGDRPWRIGIRHPRQTGILASIELEGDASVFTSGDYERFFEVDGKRYHHIIDPRTGYPADATTSVTVIHTDAATADAAATALFVAGPGQWVDIARHMPIQYVLLIDTDGIIHLNPAMQARIRFEPGVMPEIRISEPLS